MPRRNANEIIERVDQLRSSLLELVEATRQQTLSSGSRRIINSRIDEIRQGLDDLMRGIDPIKMPTSVFDPAEPKIVGRFVAMAMVAQGRKPLSELEKFYGSGVYAIYYRGDFPLYGPIRGMETPIYVGKADPATDSARNPVEQADRLSRRLADHVRSIGKANNLSLDDFDYRALVVQSGWQSAAEDYLIHLFRPIWNNEIGILYGLGKHGDAASTRSNRRSPWDTLHAGREWAANPVLVNAKEPGEIEIEARKHFQEAHVFSSLEDVLTSFIEELRQD